MGYGDSKPRWPKTRFQAEDCIQISLNNLQSTIRIGIERAIGPANLKLEKILKDFRQFISTKRLSAQNHHQK